MCPKGIGHGILFFLATHYLQCKVSSLEHAPGFLAPVLYPFPDYANLHLWKVKHVYIINEGFYLSGVCTLNILKKKNFLD